MVNPSFIISIIYYALFKKQIFKNESDVLKQFPKNIFGVFSTVRRAHKLKVYPIDIHGCIGYWDKNFKTIKKELLYRHALDVSFDSVWKDKRNTYFTPIETEPESLLELDFMHNPVYKINKETGHIIDLDIKFTNKLFGIIIQTTNYTKRATYLPNVFPTLSWNKLIISIKEKANIITDEFELFAYKITQIKTPFTYLLTNKIFSTLSLVRFTSLLLDNLKPNLSWPIIYSCKNDMLEWNTDDNVRNIATLSELFRYIQIFPKLATLTKLKIIKDKINIILENLDQFSSQSISFLGFVYKLNKKNSNLFCTKLLKDLPFAEKEFAQSEIIIGLNQAGCKNYKNKNKNLTFQLSDSIFRMNWVIQAIISTKTPLSQELVDILQIKISKLLHTNSETNYFAVAFEALCFVYTFYTFNFTVLQQMFELLFKLEHRKVYNNTLYSFLDKTARIDITGHIMNGFFILFQSKK